MFDKLDVAMRRMLDELSEAAWSRYRYDVVNCGDYTVRIHAVRRKHVDFDLLVEAHSAGQYDALWNHIDKAFEAELDAAEDGVGGDESDTHLIFSLGKPKS